MKISNNIVGRFLSVVRRWRTDYSENRKLSYSQCGEDLIVCHLFAVLGLKHVRYLDIGAHHPKYLSNTYLFYMMGHSGVTVEPDPKLHSKFLNVRSRDTNLNIGVSAVGEGVADFYIMSTQTLNTFQKAEALRFASYGRNKIIKTIQVRLQPIMDVIDFNFQSCPNFISLDVEGMDYDILCAFDFDKYRPEVFCVETLTYTEDGTERKIGELIELMESNDYMVYADTYINTIFVSRKAWGRRLK